MSSHTHTPNCACLQLHTHGQITLEFFLLICTKINVMFFTWFQQTKRSGPSWLNPDVPNFIFQTEQKNDPNCVSKYNVKIQINCNARTNKAVFVRNVWQEHFREGCCTGTHFTLRAGLGESCLDHVSSPSEHVVKVRVWNCLSPGPRSRQRKTCSKSLFICTVERYTCVHKGTYLFICLFILLICPSTLKSH